MQEPAIETENSRRGSVQELRGAVTDHVENGGGIHRRHRDHIQDLARRRLLLEGLCDLTEGFVQALLEFVNPCGSWRRCLTDARSLGFRLHVRGLCPAP